jgi:hypothetical protein
MQLMGLSVFIVRTGHCSRRRTVISFGATNHDGAMMKHTSPATGLCGSCQKRKATSRHRPLHPADNFPDAPSPISHHGRSVMLFFFHS